MSLVGNPDLLIYLRSSIPNLVSQIQKRGREYEKGIRIDYGQKIGKTILFAKNHNHAEAIRDAFEREYPNLPGFAKEDIHLDLEGDVLTVSAERHSEWEDSDKKGNYLRCERSFGQYSRSFDVSNVETDQIRADYNNGVLKLTMPKKGKTVPASRRIEIR